MRHFFQKTSSACLFANFRSNSLSSKRIFVLAKPKTPSDRSNTCLNPTFSCVLKIPLLPDLCKPFLCACTLSTASQEQPGNGAPTEKLTPWKACAWCLPIIKCIILTYHPLSIKSSGRRMIHRKIRCAVIITLKHQVEIYWETVEKYDMTNPTVCRYLKFLKFYVFSESCELLFCYRLLFLAWYNLCKAVIGNFFYVVHHTIKKPLDIDFYFAP